MIARAERVWPRSGSERSGDGSEEMPNGEGVAAGAQH